MKLFIDHALLTLTILGFFGSVWFHFESDFFGGLMVFGILGLGISLVIYLINEMNT